MKDGQLFSDVYLKDVHPSSWYAVAWYPLYSIPEGKLKTSFLTFHAFVHSGYFMNYYLNYLNELNDDVCKVLHRIMSIFH